MEACVDSENAQIAYMSVPVLVAELHTNGYFHRTVGWPAKGGKPQEMRIIAQADAPIRRLQRRVLDKVRAIFNDEHLAGFDEILRAATTALPSDDGSERDLRVAAQMRAHQEARDARIELHCCALPTCALLEKHAKEFQKCSGCRSVFYCSREHQQAHWKAHKADCTRVGGDSGHGAHATPKKAKNTTCAACGTRLKIVGHRCSRCASVEYCSRACELSHQHEHKPSCDAHVHLFTMGRAEDQEQLEKAKSVKQHAKKLKHARKSGIPVCSLSSTAFGPVGPGLPLPDGVPRNFSLKQAARLAFDEGPGKHNELKRGNFKGEGSYRDYFLDLEEDLDTWLAFFDDVRNYEHAEHTSGILGTYATILRQRGNLELCEKVPTWSATRNWARHFEYYRAWQTLSLCS